MHHSRHTYVVLLSYLSTLIYLLIEVAQPLEALYVVQPLEAMYDYVAQPLEFGTMYVVQPVETL